MGKVALVTGASRGIGAATAELLAADGIHVIINYNKNQSNAQHVLRRIQSHGGAGECLQADISVEDNVREMFDKIRSQHQSLDILVNNAGILMVQSKLVDVSSVRLENLFSTNVYGAVYCSQEALKLMGSSYGHTGGSIVNVSSVASKLGAPNEYINYAMTKGALDVLTIGLSKEFASENIRFNAVRPGFIETEMHADGGEPERVQRIAPQLPLQRGGTPLEVAEAISWLASPKASYVTGSFIDLAGGK